MATCTHLDTPGTWRGDAERRRVPRVPGQGGDRWVHLRMCRQCGHVGCCDSSPGSTPPRTFTGPDIRRALVRARRGLVLVLPGRGRLRARWRRPARRTPEPAVELGFTSAAGPGRRGAGEGTAGVRPALPAAAVRLVARAGGRRRRADDRRRPARHPLAGRAGRAGGGRPCRAARARGGDHGLRGVRQPRSGRPRRRGGEGGALDGAVRRDRCAR